ncbi:hypothetical protein KPC_2426 [Acinetobacter stercoris]|uniref:Uncharacterized protein n=1 Tax=Acinetobacter stercoris TaxID=2126983 RepID=A0A2U3N0Q7_9GAMM|nr:hypothetical protein KPC_2426 [Acinetobacter stercoris]
MWHHMKRKGVANSLSEQLKLANSRMSTATKKLSLNTQN